MSKAAELAKSGDTLTNQPSGRRNMITNGGMVISQRAVSTTGQGNANGYFACDRFKIAKDATTAGRLTISQSTDAPFGFSNSLKLDCTTADTSIAAGERLSITTGLEGFDVQRIGQGTNGALPMTFSFYVKGDQAATYNIELYDTDNDNTFYKRFNVTTNWNRIIINIPANASGAFTNDNGESLAIAFWLNAGATYNGGTFVEGSWSTSAPANLRSHSSNTQFFDSTDRELFITGVQLEIGNQATPFEHRTFGEELHLCKRYYNLLTTGAASKYISMASAYNTAQFTGVIQLNPTMRATPTIDIVTGTNYYRCVIDATNFSFDVLAIDGADNKQVLWAKGGLNSITSGSGGWLQTTNTASYMAFQCDF